MEIRPIKTKADYEAALKEIETFMAAEADTPEGDRLDVLVTLIEAYERVHYPIDFPDPVEAIKFRMEQQGLSRKDLEPLIGTRTRVAEVLNRKRSLSIGMVRRLHDHLGIFRRASDPAFARRRRRLSVTVAKKSWWPRVPMQSATQNVSLQQIFDLTTSILFAGRSLNRRLSGHASAS